MVDSANGWSLDTSHGIPRLREMASMSVMLYVNKMSLLDLGDLFDRSFMGMLQFSLNSSVEPSRCTAPLYQILKADH